MTEQKLTDMQRLFVNAYLRTFNATQAALEAGYSEKTARFIGSENLTKPNIRALLEARMSEEAMSANEVLRHLAEIARGDIDNILDKHGNIDLDKARELGVTRLIKKLKTRTITTEESDIVVTQAELYSRMDALKLIGQFHALFSERVIVEDWRMRAIEDIQRGVIDYRSLVEAFDEPTATELFTRAGATIPSE